MENNHVITDPKYLITDELKRKGLKISELKMPKKVYLAVTGIVNEFINKEVLDSHTIPLAGGVMTFKGNSNVGLVKSHLGSPGIAIQAEDLIAAGVEELIHLGFVGGIQSSLEIGGLIITEGAFNDTGIAKLYGYDEQIIYSNEQLTSEIRSDLLKKNIDIKCGLHWTTDAGYLETWGQVKKYRDQNALCVEMEAVGLFTVARYRNVKATALYVISDVIDESGWQVGWSAGSVDLGIQKLVGTIIEMT